MIRVAIHSCTYGEHAYTMPVPISAINNSTNVAITIQTRGWHSVLPKSTVFHSLFHVTIFSPSFESSHESCLWNARYSTWVLH